MPSGDRHSVIVSRPAIKYSTTTEATLMITEETTEEESRSGDVKEGIGKVMKVM